MKNNFYVYCYKDQFGPFYFGKGTGTRYLDHLRKAKLNQDNAHFLNRIRKLLREDTPPVIEFIQKDLTEDQAFALEIQLIKQYGRRDLGQGILLNETDGGEGSSGHLSPRKGKTFDELYGLEKSKSIKNKIAQACIDRRDDIIAMNKRIHTGKTISKEQIEKHRQKTIGQKRTEEQKQNLSKGMTGIKKTFTEETYRAKQESAQKQFKDTLIINNGILNKRIKPDELEYFKSQGWKQGNFFKKERKKNSSFSISEAFLSHPRGPRKCKIDDKIYNSIKDAMIEYSLSAYFIKKIPTFEFLED